MQVEHINSTKILVADDNPTSLLFLTTILREYGNYEVVECEESTKVCDLAEKESPNLIFLDVCMPELDGFEVCRRLKANPKLKKIPVIFLTGSAEALGQRLKGFDAGGVDYLIKPIESEELLARVQSHLEIYRMRNMLEAVVDLQSKNIKEYYDAYNQINHFLSKSKEAHHQIMSNLGEGVFTMNQDGICTYINDTAANFFRKEPAKTLIGQDIAKRYIDSEEVPFNADSWQEKIKKQHAFAFKAKWRREDGDAFYVEYRIRQVTDENGQMKIVVIFNDVTNIRLAENKIKSLAHKDSLTGLANRSGLINCLKENIKKQKTEHKKFAVLMLDLDDFKWINDNFGHIMGDLALSTVAQRIKTCLDEGDVAGRLGGDEFLVILNSISTRSEALQLAQKINTAINQPIKTDDTQISITASIGVALYLDADVALTNHAFILEQTDFSLYQAKVNNKGSISVFGDAMRRILESEKALSNDLMHIIERDELNIVLQPQFRIADNSFYGAEILARWNHPYKGFLNANEFIPIAEKMGFIRELSDWVFDKTTDYISSWLKKGYQTRNIAINLCAQQIAVVGFEQRILRELENKKIDAQNITLELTETMLIQINKTSKKALKTLADAGIKIALDDFGTGYSSLTLLNQIDIDILKLNSEFISGVPKKRKSVEIVKSLIQLAEVLDLTVIAEKIEHDYQAVHLNEYGCDVGQGYYYSKPISIQEFEQFIAKPSPSLADIKSIAKK